MKDLFKMMTRLIRSEILGVQSDIDRDLFTADKLNDLYNLSKNHDLAHIVGNALIKNGLISDTDIKDKFEKEIITAVYRYEKINHEFERIKGVFNDAGIKYLPLKGAVIRSFYPEPWMRTSCDIDILVHETDLNDAMRQISDGLGYEIGSKGSHDVSLFSKSGVHLELHFNLIENAVLGIADKVLSEVWDYAEPVDNKSSMYSMRDDMLYYYNIAHMAKHFQLGGCGIRPFLDTWILNHDSEFDSDKRRTLLEKGGLLAFSNEAELLSEVWFGESAHSDLTRYMEDYIVRGGVYGNIFNNVSVKQARFGGKFGYAISKIFLPYSELRLYYPILNEHKILVPVYEIKRWCRLLMGGGIARSVDQLRINKQLTDKQVHDADNMLKKLGL